MGTRRILTAKRREEAERLRARRNPPFLHRRETLWFASHGNKAGYFLPWQLIQEWALETGRRHRPYHLLGFMADVSRLLAEEWTDKVLVVELPGLYALVFAGDELALWKSQLHGQLLRFGGDPKIGRMPDGDPATKEFRYVALSPIAALFAKSWRREFPGLLPLPEPQTSDHGQAFVTSMNYSTFSPSGSWEPYATDTAPQPQSPL